MGVVGEAPFQNGYKKVNGTCSLTSEEAIGLILLTAGVSGIAFTAYGLSKDVVQLLIAGVFLLLCMLLGYMQRPIRVIHTFSAMISLYVRTDPFLDRRENFPNSSVLEDPEFVKKVIAEMQQILSRTNGGKDIRFSKDTFDGKENAYIGRDVEGDRGWRIYMVKAGSLFTQHGRRDFPTLVEALEKMPEVKSCAMSMLDGNTEIPMHCGYFKGMLRYMLPLQVPSEAEKCYLCVNGLKYVWSVGEGVLWDDMYPHRVENRTNDLRIVLYMDVVRPLPPGLKTLGKIGLDLFANSPDVKKEIEQTETKRKIQPSVETDKDKTM